MSQENINRARHLWFEGNNNLQEIIDNANVGDYIELITNNQMGWELLEVVRVSGKNQTVVVKTMYDIMEEE